MEKVDDGFQRGAWERYEAGVRALEAVERDVLARQEDLVREAGTSGAGAVA